MLWQPLRKALNRAVTRTLLVRRPVANGCARFRVEGLESRDLLANNVTASLSGGLLRIEGTEKSDVILVEQHNGLLSIENVPILVRGRLQGSVRSQDVTQIEVAGLAGDDFLAISGAGVSAFSGGVSISGGLGSDTIVAPAGSSLDSDPADQLLTESEWANNSLLPRPQNGFAVAPSVLDNALNAEIIAYELQNHGMLTLNVMQHTYYADVDLGFGVKLDTTKLQELLKGQATLPQIDLLKLLSSAVNRDGESNEYDAVRDSFYAQFSGGANEVYITSERFTNWASPQKIAELAAKIAAGSVTGGYSTDAAINEVKSMMLLEFWDMVSWAQRKWGHGASGVDGLMLGLDGLARDLSHSAYWIPVTYHEGGMDVSHRAFAIRTTDPDSGSLAVESQYFSNPFDISSVTDIIGGTTSGVAVEQLLDNVWSLFVTEVSGELPLSGIINVADEAASFSRTLMAAAIDSVIYNTLLNGTGINAAAVRIAQEGQGGTSLVDLRGTDIETNVINFLNRLSPNNHLAQGNRGSVTITKLQFDTSDYTLVVEFDIHHKHSWGSLNDAVKELKDAGAKFVDIVSELWDKAGDDINAWARAIRNAGGEFNEIVDALWDKAGHKLDDMAKALYDAGARFGDIVTHLWDKSGQNLSELAKALDAVGARLNDIASNLWAKAGQSLNTIVGALWGVTHDLGGVAGALWGVKQDFGSIATALRSVSSDLPAIAKALNNLGANMTQMAAVLGADLSILENGIRQTWTKAGQYIKQTLSSAGQLLKEWIYYDGAGQKLYQWRAWANGKLTDFEQYTTAGWVEINKYLSTSGKWVSQILNSAGQVLKEWIYYDDAGQKLYQWRAWANGKLTDFEQYTTAGWMEINKYISSSGKWVSQTLDSAGKLLKEWIYYDDAGQKLYQWRAWANGKLTDFEQYTTAGWQEINKYISTSGKWVSQTLDSAGKVLKEWIYYDDVGQKLYQWRAWANGKLTDFEQYTTAGWMEINKYISTSGKWVSQTLNSVGQVLKEWIYYDDAGQKLYQWRAWANGKLTDFEQYTTAGWQEFDQWLDSSGRWVSQKLDSAGKVLSEWLYYDAAAQKLYQWRAWSGSKLTNLYRYTSSGVPTFQAYISTTGNWVERTYTNGVETAVRIWNAAGTYLGDQLKNFSDAASRLDPTTTSWWPF